MAALATISRFDASLLVLGVLLIAGALISGLARRTVVSAAALFVLVGFALGPGGTNAVHFDARSPFVSELATIALIVILFRDGLEVEGEMLQNHWALPLRKLGLAMPLTAVIVALATRWLVGLSWTESFLLGALLAPTDPVLSSAAVTNPRVPRLVRHSLNLESGLNDGLALTAVLAFADALGASHSGFVWWRFVLEDVTIGLAAGILAGWLGGALMPRGEPLAAGIPGHQRSLYALGIALLAYGLAALPPHGNGLIAVFAAAITLGIRRPDIARWFQAQAADLVELVKLGVFVVFGSLLTVHGLFGDGAAAAGVVAVTLLLARPAAVAVALWRTGCSSAERAYMAWFGPKGVSTLTFSLLVLGERVTAGGRIFNLAALTVVCSIIVHGLSDTPGAEWIARRDRARTLSGPRRRAAPDP